MNVPDTEKPMTRLEFRKVLGYPLIPMCPACRGLGDHRLRDGTGFTCQVDYTKESSMENDESIFDKDEWIVMNLLMHPVIYQPANLALNKRGPTFKTEQEAHDWIKSNTSQSVKPHHELNPE